MSDEETQDRPSRRPAARRTRRSVPPEGAPEGLAPSPIVAEEAIRGRKASKKPPAAEGRKPVGASRSDTEPAGDTAGSANGKGRKRRRKKAAKGRAASAGQTARPLAPKPREDGGVDPPTPCAATTEGMDRPAVGSQQTAGDFHAYPPADPPRPSDVQQHLYEIQRNLDRLLRDVGQYQDGASSRRRAAEALNLIASQFLPADMRSTVDDPHLRAWLSPARWARHIGRFAMRFRSDEVDEFGLDRTYEAHLRPILDLLFERYFRVQVDGLQHIPTHGRAVLVCNRGGALPWDGVMLKLALAKHHPREGTLRWLLEDITYHSPFLGAALCRVGAVRACPENAERLLEKEALVAVFPEGINGVSKLYKHRYQLQRFGRGGAVKLALRMQAPVIPVAVVGAEDAYPMLYRVGGLSRLLGVPFVPVTPTFPWLGPAGLLPLPSRFAILAGPPVAEVGELGPEAAEDIGLVHELNERVRLTVQELVDQARALRGDRVYS